MATERKKLSSEGIFLPKKAKERNIMSNNNNNQLNIPQAREAGSVGGQMVKKICPVRTTKFDRNVCTAMGHIQTVEYIFTIGV
jgi:hypothetical protein